MRVSGRRGRGAGYALVALGLACSSPPAQSPSQTPAPPAPSCDEASLTVVTAEQAARLNGCSHLAGDLIIGPSFTLESIAELDRPITIGGDLDVSGNPLLGGLFSASLRRVDGSVIIDGNGALATVSLHAIESIGGDLRIIDNDSLMRVDFSSLTSVAGQVEISGNPVLEQLELSRLTKMRTIQIEDNPGLQRQPSRRGDPDIDSR